MTRDQILQGNPLAVGEARRTQGNDARSVLLGAWAWRFELVQDGSASPVDEITMIVLASTMFISIVSFILTLLMCIPKEE